MAAEEMIVIFRWNLNNSQAKSGLDGMNKEFFHCAGGCLSCWQYWFTENAYGKSKWDLVRASEVDLTEINGIKIVIATGGCKSLYKRGA
jgi:hypothetical protein